MAVRVPRGEASGLNVIANAVRWWRVGAAALAMMACTGSPLAQPAAPAASPGARGPVASPTVFVREIRVEGNTVFATADLAPVTAPFTGRALANDELQELRHRLTLFYVERGYLTSGAILPDQDLRDGVLVVRIVEGRLSEVRVRGARDLDPAYVQGRIEAGTQGPLHIDALRERLQLLQQSPLIGLLRGELRPGAALGQSILEVEVEEAVPWSVAAIVANDQSPSVGGTHASVELAHRNLSGRGDVLFASVGRTEGMTDGRAYYAIPLSARDAVLRLGYEASRSTVVEDPFDGLDIESRGETASLGLVVPVARTLARELLAGAQLERRYNQTSLVGVPFSFFAGARDGRSAVTALRLLVQHLERSASDVLALRSTLSVGLPWFGASAGPGEPDGRFVAWLGQAQWGRRLPATGGELAARVELQLASGSLLPMEKFALGGAQSTTDRFSLSGVGAVRGYRKNSLVRDAAFAASLEYWQPLWRAEPGPGELSVVAFADYGRGWERAAGEDAPPDIGSVGLGLRWSTDGWLAAAQVGLPLRNVEREHRDLQDRGFHFLVQYAWH